MLQSKQSLEKYRIFPYVAWILVVGFALFVYTIVMHLQVATAELGVINETNSALLNKPVDQITDFTR